MAGEDIGNGPSSSTSGLRKRISTPPSTAAKPREDERGLGELKLQPPSFGDSGSSLLKVRRLKDLLARLGFVGIFIVENALHATYFEHEIQGMVMPALAPLPREVAVSLHLVHVIFGSFGALFVILSGFDTGGRTMLTKGTSMMLVFMTTITWVWWINRGGVLYWDVDPYPFWDVRCSPEKRNRTVHILKNFSIIGSLTMYQQMAKYEIEASPARPSFLEGLVTSLRLWSCVGTLAPHFVLLAVLQCIDKLTLPEYSTTFALIIALCAVQCAANLVNSYRDYEKGIDTEDAGDRTLVDRLVSVTLLKVLAALCGLFWLVYLVWAMLKTNFHPGVVSLPMLGSYLAVGYTAGPFPLKYWGLGDLAIFIAFGPGVIAFSSTVLTGAVQWKAILFTMPVTMYVIGTLQANNHRDLESDKQRGARTLAVILGHNLSLKYYYFLLLGSHCAALAVGASFGCIGVLGSLAALPQSIWLCIRIHRKSTLRTQDEETAKGSMMFGVSLALGIMTMPGMEVSRLGLGVCGLVVFVLKMFTD